MELTKLFLPIKGHSEDDGDTYPDFVFRHGRKGLADALGVFTLEMEGSVLYASKQTTPRKHKRRNVLEEEPAEAAEGGAGEPSGKTSAVGGRGKGKAKAKAKITSAVGGRGAKVKAKAKGKK